MEHGYIISILYEMALVIGSEVSVKPLLTKTLQRLLYHTAFPAGFVSLAVPTVADSAGMVEIRFDAAVGDYALAGLIGQTVRLPARLLLGGAERSEDAALLASLPGRPGRYAAYLRLPIDGRGVIVLLAPHSPDTELPLTELFRPVMANLARAIELCSYHDAYTGGLIAAREATQQAFVSSEARFRAISTALLDALIMVDDDARIVYWNPAAERILGYRAEEVRGKQLHQLLTPERYRSAAAQGFETFRRTGQGPVIGRTIEMEALRKDGHEIPVELSISAVRLEGRWHAVGILRDISERKQADQALREASAYNRSLIEASPDPLVTIGPEGSITDVNTATEEATGRTRKDLTGTDFSDYFTDPRQARAGYQQVFREGIVRDYPLEIQHRDGRITPVLYNAAIFRDEAGKVAGVFAAARDVTKLRRTEEKLRHSESVLKEAQRIARLGNWEFDLTTKQLIVSDEVYRIFEVSPQELGTSAEALMRVIHPHDRDHVKQAYADSIRERTRRDIDHRLLMRDGRIKYVHQSWETDYDDRGTALRSIGTMQDITTQRLAELGLQKSNRALQALSAATGLVVRATDESRLLDEVCRILVSIGGYQLAWVGFPQFDAEKSIRAVARFGEHADRLDEVRLTWGEGADGQGATGAAIRAGRIQVQEDIAHVPKYERRNSAVASGFGSSIALPMFDENDRVFGVINLYGREPNTFDADEIKLLQELSENLAFGIRTLRLRAERDHHAQETRRRAAELKSVLDTMLEGVLVANAEGQIVLANRSALRLLGWDSRVPLQLSLSDLPGRWQLHDAGGEPISSEQMGFARALAGEIVVDADESVRTPGTLRDTQLRVSSAPIRIDHRITGAVLVTRDITELRELERLKEQFISVAAHELKTPVTVMKGFAEALLRQGGELSEPRRKMLEAINRGADRIDMLIVDLLDISRMAAGHLELRLERVDLLGILEAVVPMAAIAAPKHHIRIVDSRSIVTLADRQRIEQVVRHLLTNAVKYSPSGGDIDVSLTLEDGQATVRVRDHGIGIPADKQGRVFQRFYRAHTGTPYDYGGMGVGLYITKEIVERHGGRIWFESEENRGSTFIFRLPLRT